MATMTMEISVECGGGGEVVTRLKTPLDTHWKVLLLLARTVALGPTQGRVVLELIQSVLSCRDEN